jgi:hypothetical protein
MSLQATGQSVVRLLWFLIHLCCSRRAFC